MNALMKKEPTMTSREIAELTGKRHPDVKRDCDVMFTELGLDVSNFARIYLDSMNREQTEYALPRDLVETLITGYSIKLRHAVIQRLHDLEAQLAPPVLLPQDLPSALRALADTHEQLQQVQFERDIAVKTKAHISDKKTATAMATASCAVRETNRLKEQLGRCRTNATVLAVSNQTGRDYEWQPLKKWCKSNDTAPHSVNDERYGQVNSIPSASMERSLQRRFIGIVRWGGCMNITLSSSHRKNSLFCANQTANLSKPDFSLSELLGKTLDLIGKVNSTNKGVKAYSGCTCPHGRSSLAARSQIAQMPRSKHAALFCVSFSTSVMVRLYEGVFVRASLLFDLSANLVQSNRLSLAAIGSTSINQIGVNHD